MKLTILFVSAAMIACSGAANAPQGLDPGSGASPTPDMQGPTPTPLDPGLPPSVTTAAKLKALSSKRQWLAHQSVGQFIFHGPAGRDDAGLGRLLLDNPGSGVTMVRDPGSLAEVPAGRWAESYNGRNGDPAGKLASFDVAFRTTFAGGLDYAAVKFCYVDVESGTDLVALWARYVSVMDALEASYPGRIIHWTVPVTSGDNSIREAFSDRIRARYGSTGRVFDVADWESRSADGSLALCGGIRCLNAAWDGDGGHPNTAGANMLAEKYVNFMYEVVTARR